MSRYKCESFIVGDVVERWIQENIYGSLSWPRSLILWGVSRTGKTEFARVIDEYWYMNTDWDVSQVDLSCKYGVIDDVSADRFLY